MSQKTEAARAGVTTPERPPKENLYRSVTDHGALELRAEPNKPHVLTGHAAVFNTWTEINSRWEGHFLERLAPGAFTKTIKENRQRIRVLFQHGQDPSIGDKPLGPLRVLEEDATGLRYEVDLLPTSYNQDLIPGLKEDLYGASFRFSTLREDYVERPKRSAHNPVGLPERTLQEVRLMELGPVTFGAYPEATSGIRSVTDDVLRQMFVQDVESARKGRTQVSFSMPRVTVNGQELRADQEAVDLLSQMEDLGKQFIGHEAGEDDAAEDQAAMNEILVQIAALKAEEQTEPDPEQDTGSEDVPLPRATEPEPPGATTPEPEPSGVTTRSDSTNLFWFVDTPKHLRGN